MANTDLNTQVKEALERTEIMALSTIGEDGSWTSPVQYHHDEKLNLFFMSLPDSKHVQNILKDPRVSVAIYKDVPLPNGGNLGLQIKGTAKLDNADKVTEGWQHFKITPEEVWIFDSRITRERQQVNLSDLRL
jgi:general stress protein 26